MQLAAVSLFGIAFAGYPLVAATRLVRGRRVDGVARHGRLLAGTGLLAVFGLFGYLIYLMMTAAQSLGPLIAGRPIPWLILQMLAIATVVALVATTISWWANRSSIPGAEQVRTAVLVAAGLVFVPWALYWGLLLP